MSTLIFNDSFSDNNNPDMVQNISKELDSPFLNSDAVLRRECPTPSPHRRINDDNDLEYPDSCINDADAMSSGTSLGMGSKLIGR